MFKSRMATLIYHVNPESYPHSSLLVIYARLFYSRVDAGAGRMCGHGEAFPALFDLPPFSANIFERMRALACLQCGHVRF